MGPIDQTLISNLNIAEKSIKKQLENKFLELTDKQKESVPVGFYRNAATTAHNIVYDLRLYQPVVFHPKTIDAYYPEDRETVWIDQLVVIVSPNTGIEIITKDGYHVAFFDFKGKRQNKWGRKLYEFLGLV